MYLLSKGLLSVTLVAVSQVASGFNLSEFYAMALTRSPEWRAAEARRDQAREFVPQARANLLPSVNLSLAESKISQTLSTSGVAMPRQDFSSKSEVISLRQPILLQRQLEGLRQAEAKQNQAEFFFVESAQDLSIRIVAAYLESLLAIEEKNMLGIQAKYYETKLAAAKKAYAENLAAKIDQINIEAKLGQTLAEIKKNQSRVSNANMTLTAFAGGVTGEPSARSVNNAYTFISAVKIDRTDVVDIIERNPSVKAARAGTALAGALVRAARYANFPSVDLVVQHSSSNGENIYLAGTAQRGTSIGIQVNLQLYAGGGIISRQRQALAQARESEERFRETKNEIGLKANATIGKIDSGLMTIKASQIAEELARELLQASIRAREVGQGTDVDVMDASLQMSRATLVTLNAKCELLLDWLRLMALNGDLSQATIDQVSTTSE